MYNALSVEGRMRPVVGLAPINITGAAKTTPWINMGQGQRLRIAFFTGTWAGGTSAVTLNQAQDNGGTGSKALAITKVWTAVLSGQTADVLAEVAVVSNTFNLDTAAKLYVVEVQDGDLDINNGFNFVQAATASPGANADLLAILMDLYDCDWEGKPATLVSILS